MRLRAYIYSGAHGMVGGAAARVVSVFWQALRPGGLYSESQTDPAVFMKFFKVFFLLLLLGGDYGLEPASLGAFPTQTHVVVMAEQTFCLLQLVLSYSLVLASSEGQHCLLSLCSCHTA